MWRKKRRTKEAKRTDAAEKERKKKNEAKNQGKNRIK